MLRANTTTFAEPPVRGRRVPWRWLLRGFERTLAVVGALALLSYAAFDISVITSPSMSPTLQGNSIDDGDRVLTEKLSYWFRQPRRWEVIAYTRDDGMQILKRVAGLPGEQVQLDDKRYLLIDGRRVEPPHALNARFLRYGNLFDGKPVACKTGYYVLGDDLKDSDDSRFNGPVRPDRLIGRAWLIVWPPERFGWVR